MRNFSPVFCHTTRLPLLSVLNRAFGFAALLAVLMVSLHLPAQAAGPSAPVSAIGSPEDATIQAVATETTQAADEQNLMSQLMPVDDVLLDKQKKADSRFLPKPAKLAAGGRTAGAAASTNTARTSSYSMIADLESDADDEGYTATRSSDRRQMALGASNTASRGFAMPFVRNGAFKLMMPLEAYVVTSRYGWRHGRPHQGTDFGARIGTPIHAAESGTVVQAGWFAAYGKAITIDHGNGMLTRYGHCSSINVHEGETVNKGDTIGRVGSTGRSTGPHLHFEVIAGDQHRNPEPFLFR